MTPPPYGNPILQVRLDPEIQDRLRELAGEPAEGRAGGMSLMVRRLIYRELMEPVPKKWGQEEGAMEDLFELAEQAQAPPADQAGAQDLLEALAIPALGDPDIIRRNFARQILGELAAKLLKSGGLSPFIEPAAVKRTTGALRRLGKKAEQ